LAVGADVRGLELGVLEEEAGCAVAGVVDAGVDSLLPAASPDGLLAASPVVLGAASPSVAFFAGAFGDA
jgi:hypothetical protein